MASIALLFKIGDLQKTCQDTRFLCPVTQHLFCCRLPPLFSCTRLTQRNPLLAWPGETCNSLKNSAEVGPGDRSPWSQQEAGGAFIQDTRAPEWAVPLSGVSGGLTWARSVYMNAPQFSQSLRPSSRPFCRLKMGACFRNSGTQGPERNDGSAMEGWVLCPAGGGLDSSCPWLLCVIS